MSELIDQIEQTSIIPNSLTAVVMNTAETESLDNLHNSALNREGCHLIAVLVVGTHHMQVFSLATKSRDRFLLTPFHPPNIQRAKCPNQIIMRYADRPLT